MELDRFAGLLVEFDEVIQRTLRFNRHAVERADLLADLWLAWHDLATTQGEPLDLAAPRDRERLVEAWRRGAEAVGRRERAQRGAALSLDVPLSPDGNARPLIDSLLAEPTSDPAVALTELEELLAIACLRALAREGVEGTWSQPAGYLILLRRLQGAHALAVACGIAPDTLQRRIEHLMGIHMVQARLFDGHARLAARDVRAPPRRVSGARRSTDGSRQPVLWDDEVPTRKSDSAASSP